MNESSSGGQSATASTSSSMDSNNDEARNGTSITVTATEESSSENTNSEHQQQRRSNRHSSYSTGTFRSNVSWPELTPDSLCPMARYSGAYSLEEVDYLSVTSQHNDLTILPPVAADDSSAAARGESGGEGEQVLQQLQTGLYDPPHATYIPASKRIQSHDGSTRINTTTEQQYEEVELKRPPPSPASTTSPTMSPAIHLQHLSRRRRSSFDLKDLDATILFVDLEGYSKTTNLTQRVITRAFMNTLSNLLTFCYDSLPSRMNVKDYVILPTGDGAAVVVIRPPLRRVLQDDTAVDFKGGHCGGGGECGNDNGAALSRRRRSSFDLKDLDATILFVDLEGYSKTTNLTQRVITRAFMNTLSNLLTFCYDSLPSRMNVKDYVILPTGDGAAVVVIRPPLRRVLQDDTAVDFKGGHCDGGGECGNDNGAATTAVNGVTDRLSQSSISSSSSEKQLFGLHCSSCSRISLQTTEETALWLGSSLLLWSESIQIGMRVGLNSGELSIVEDPYGDPNVCGDAINMANRIMDTALPGQILASAGTVVTKLNHMQTQCNDRDECFCSKCPLMKIDITVEPSEVVVKHGVTTNVQSITVTLYPLPQEPPRAVGDDTHSEDRHASESDEIDDVGNDSYLKRIRSLSIGEQIPIHPLAEIKANPKKQSFASLSSLQPSTSFTGAQKKQQQQQQRSKSAFFTNSSFTLKRPSMGAQNTTAEAASAADTTSSKSTSGGTPSIHSNIDSSATSDRRSTVTTAESSQITTSPQLPFHIGNHQTPATKWYMKVKPTEMKADFGRIKPKVLPQELIRRHHKIAFIGIMHDNLSKAFVNILEADPQHRWDQVFVLFPSDACLLNSLVQNYSMQQVEKLIENKNACRSSLHELLSPVVTDLRFLQYDQLMHCGSYWDWCDPGGFIHVSPLTWGANPKTCPAMNYYWNSKVPSPEYRVYREGLGYLLKVATPF